MQLDDRNEYAHWAFGISCWSLLRYDESFAHMVLNASHIALSQVEAAQQALQRCRTVIPNICLDDLQRVPLKDRDKMDQLRERLQQAGLAALPS